MIFHRVALVLAASLTAFLAAGLPRSGAAQPAPRPPQARPQAPAANAPAPAAASVPATPQQTTAVFADWTLRCTRAGTGTGTGTGIGTGPVQQFCEVVQGIQRDDRPVAQVAVGRPGKGQPLQLTILVPPSVGFGAAPAVTTGRDGDTPVLEMAWRRCVPAGCIADGVLGDEALNRLRGWAEPGRITFQDGAGRAAGLPFSPRGLAQALDALARED